MFFDVGFDRDEVLIDELRRLRIFVRLGIQPSTRASSRCGAEVQQDRLALFFCLLKRLIDGLAPIHGHKASLH